MKREKTIGYIVFTIFKVIGICVFKYFKGLFIDIFNIFKDVKDWKYPYLSVTLLVIALLILPICGGILGYKMI